MVWIVYGAMCAIWGTTWVVIKDGLRYLPPLTGVGFRFVLAAALLYPVAAIRGEFRLVRNVPWRLVGAMAVLFFGLDYVLIYAAETHLDSGLVAVLFGTMPFFTFGFGYLLNRERTTPRVLIGALIAFAGVAVICAATMHGSPLYFLAAIGAAASGAFGNVYVKTQPSHSPLVTLPPAMLIAGLAESAIGVSTEHVNWAIAFAPQSLAALAYLAAFGSGLAFFCNLWTLQRLPAWMVGMTTLIIPVVAVAVGVAFGGEHFTMREGYGSIAVAAGVALTLLPKRVARERKARACAA